MAQLEGDPEKVVVVEDHPARGEELDVEQPLTSCSFDIHIGSGCMDQVGEKTKLEIAERPHGSVCW